MNIHISELSGAVAEPREFDMTQPARRKTLAVTSSQHYLRPDRNISVVVPLNPYRAIYDLHTRLTLMYVSSRYQD
jgi:hypothetical protein